MDSVDGSGGGSVIELAQTGPPTRKLKTPVVTDGEITCDS